jgi:DNA-binding beta-propeller fold protein YncE
VVAGGGGYFLVGRSSGSGGSAPGCTTSAARAASLTRVATKRVLLGGKPFAVKTSPDGRYAFVTVNNGIAVLRQGSGLAPTLLRTIHIPGADNGLAITGNGRYLLAAGGSGAVVISVAAAEQGAPDPVTGRLESTSGDNAGAVQVQAYGDYAFVTLQNTTKMAVFNLGRALSTGFGPADFVGYVPLGVQPVGIGKSADGKWLYVTSFSKKDPPPAEGTLSVVSMHEAETHPATSVKSAVDAGCSPARVVTSADGKTVWVTARDSNAVLAFSAAKLRSDPAQALMAKVSVGMSPIGLTLVAGDTRVVVADSDLGSASGQDAGLAVISTSAALAGRPALLGMIPAGAITRQVTVTNGGQTLLATSEGSGQLQAVNLGDLP